MIDFLNRVLEKYNLQENVVLTTETDLKQIIKKMESDSNGEYYSSLLALMDFSQPKHQKFVGQVNENGFTFRKRIGLFKLIPNLAKAKGTFSSTGELTKISMKINGMRTYWLITKLVVLSVLCLLATLVLLEALIPPIGEVNPFPNLFILIVVGFFTILVPMLYSQWNVRRMKKELYGYFV